MINEAVLYCRNHTQLTQLLRIGFEHQVLVNQIFIDTPHTGGSGFTRTLAAFQYGRVHVLVTHSIDELLGSGDTIELIEAIMLHDGHTAAPAFRILTEMNGDLDLDALCTLLKITGVKVPNRSH